MPLNKETKPNQTLESWLFPSAQSWHELKYGEIYIYRNTKSGLKSNLIDA